MDKIDSYMSLATASGFMGFALFTETELIWTPSVLMLFAAYCIVMAVLQLDRHGKRKRQGGTK